MRKSSYQSAYLLGWAFFSLVFLLGISLAPISALLNLFHDDSFFYMVIARNHAAGLGYSFDGLNQTNGFHPLWLWLLSAMGSVASLTGEKGIRMVVLLQSFLSIGAALIYVRLLALAQVKTTLLILFYFAYLFLCTFADMGQESALFGFLFALLIRGIIAGLRNSSATNQAMTLHWPGATQLLFIYALSCFIVLTRLDAFFILGGVALTLCLLGQKRAAYAVLLGVVLGIAITMGFNYMYFGHPYSISSWLKSGFDFEKLWQIGIPGLGVRVTMVLGLLLAALLNYQRHVQRKDQLNDQLHDQLSDQLSDQPNSANGRLSKLLSWTNCRTMPWPLVLTLTALLAYSAYFVVLFLEVSALGSWYFNQAIGFSLFLFTLSTVGLTSSPSKDLASSIKSANHPVVSSLWVLAPLACALVLGMLLWTIKFTGAHSSDSTKEMGEWLAVHTAPGAVIFQRDGAGAVSYFAARHIINGDGLVNNMSYQVMLRSGKLCQYLQEQGVQYIVTNTATNAAGKVQDFIALWTKGLTAVPLTMVAPQLALYTSQALPIYRVFTANTAAPQCANKTW